MKSFMVVVMTGMVLAVAARQAYTADVDLNSIVVTSSRSEESLGRVSRTVDVITGAQIEESGASDIGYVLKTLTSADVNNYGGVGAQSSIHMRGSTEQQVLVMVDGRPVNNPRDGSVDLNTIPLADIDRIEVMHGGGSSLYGSGAMGGTVNIITKRPPKEGYKTEMTSAFGTFRTYTERISHGGRFKDLGYLVSGDYVSSRGFRDNGDYIAKDLDAHFTYDLNPDNTVGLKGGFYMSRSGTPGPASSPDLDDRQRVRNNFGAFDWHWKAAEKTVVSAQLYNNYDRLEFSENTAGSIFDTAFEKSIHATISRGIDVQVRQEVTENYAVTGGLNYIDNFNDSTATAKHRYSVRAAFLQQSLTIAEKLKIDLGVRHDNYTNFGPSTNPTLSGKYTVNDVIAFRGGVARSFRAPTFNDLFWNQGGMTGNPSLQPETGINTEIGLDVTPNKYCASGLTYFHNTFDQLINWAPVDPTDVMSPWMPQNVGKAVIDGIEFTQKVYPAEWLEVYAGYTFLHPRDAKIHRDLIYQPRNKVDASVKYKNGHGFISELYGEFTGTRFADTDNSIKVKQFHYFDLNFSQKFNETLTGFIWMKNLLNAKYQILRDYPVPGFSITAGVKAEF